MPVRERQHFLLRYRYSAIVRGRGIDPRPALALVRGGDRNQPRLVSRVQVSEPVLHQGQSCGMRRRNKSSLRYRRED